MNLPRQLPGESHAMNDGVCFVKLVSIRVIRANKKPSPQNYADDGYKTLL
jgi:hypothetical protein